MPAANGDVQVRAADPENSVDVDAFRRVRLLALASDPASFGSTYAAEVSFDREAWVTRMQSFHGRPGCVFLATLPGSFGPEAIGLTGVGMDLATDFADMPEVEAPVYLSSVWVDPRVRGRDHGVADALLEAAVAWAVDAGASAVFLDVVDGNAAGERLFRRHGFTATGRVWVNDTTGAAETEFMLDLARSAPSRVQDVGG